MMQFSYRSMLHTVSGRRHDLARVGIQTVAATSIAYLVVTHHGSGDTSWAVIAALFTIGLSADATYYNAVGRIVGAVLGISLGLAAGWLAPGGALPGLLVAVLTANLVATIWPSVRYAAVTAAIVAIDPTPATAEALSVTGAILFGTLAAAAISFVLWPSFGRRRVVDKLRATISDCTILLRQLSCSAERLDRAGMDNLHARFLGHLEACHAEIASTRFEPTLPNGSGLRDAANAAESLWHSLVILDRAASDEHEAIGSTALRSLWPAVQAFARTAEHRLTSVDAMLAGTSVSDPEADDPGSALEAMRCRAEEVCEQLNAREAQEIGLHALLFALKEVCLTLNQLSDVSEARPET